MAEFSSLSSSAIEPGSLNPDSDPSLTANVRVEIDTSSPFGSVREATNRFGGFGFWKPRNPEPLQELKRQTAEMQNDVIMKERETDEVLKELEASKATVIALYSKLHHNNNNNKEESLREEEAHSHINPACMVLKDLNKAKMNLCNRTVDLSGSRRSVEVLSKQLEEERKALEKARERVMHKSLKVIEEGETTSKKDLENNALRMINEVQRLNCEAQEFKKTMGEIEQTREKIETVRMKLVAARKMKEAARAAEAVAMAEIKAVSNDGVTVSISSEEYAKLGLDARDAEEEARKRVGDAMSRVEEANVSEMDALKKLDKAAKEVETRKKALEEAMERGEMANAAKLEAEEGQWRRSSSVNNTAKFKSKSKRETTAMHLTYDFVLGPSSSSVPVLKPAMSIGQILSKKLLVGEDSDMMNVGGERRKMSLGQMLAKSSNCDGTKSEKSEGKENGKRSATTIKRKNLGFAKIALLLHKESKNKKTNKTALNLR